MPRTTIRSEDITDLQVKSQDVADINITTAKMATDPTNASNLSSGDVPLAQLGNVPLAPLEDDIAVLGFQVAAANDLAKYNLRDQIVDTFQDATGVDASASTNESRDSTGKYYTGAVSNTPSVTGGTITTDGDYTVHKFTANGNLITDTAQDYEVLVVGGGGGGGRRHGGGGGAGGLIYIDGYAVTAATHAVVVGGGGAGSTGPSVAGSNGVPSTFMNLTALGGGTGASDDAGHNVNTGGSGGGGDNQSGNEGTAAQASTNDGHAGSGFGNNGGGGANNTGGGGGGAGAAGGTHNGGDGKQYDILVASTPVYYAGGGGGGQWSGGDPHGTGGQGGGGNGENYGATGEQAGTPNTGGGGGGDGSDDSPGGAGGSGIVILRRPTTGSAPGNLTLVSTATTAEAGTTGTADVVMLYTPATGTTTLNTDLKAYVSRDNGTTYTQATLLSKGSYSGTTEIATTHDLDISGQPAGVTMRWKIEALNQSLSKVTRINGMSLGWS